VAIPSSGGFITMWSPYKLVFPPENHHFRIRGLPNLLVVAVSITNLTTKVLRMVTNQGSEIPKDLYRCRLIFKEFCGMKSPLNVK
jgi:hypothetical protein